MSISETTILALQRRSPAQAGTAPSRDAAVERADSACSRAVTRPGTTTRIRARGLQADSTPKAPTVIRADQILRDPDDGQLLAVGPYHIIGVLGKGGMGLVYEVQDIRLDRIVALKMINQGEDASDGDIQRFHKEATAAARLKHPNIIPIYDVGRVGNIHYFTMACVRGMSLLDWLRAYKPSLKQQVALVATLADAIQHAHDRGIIHRDVKPGNVLIDRAGMPFITDFGLARDNTSDERLTVSGVAVGTPEYMAPEQANGHKDAITPATDIWGLGVLLYEMLTDRVPFPGANTYDILDQIVKKEPSPPSRYNTGIDAGLEQIVLTCLAKEAQHRYHAAEALAADLRAWCQGRSLMVRAPHFFQRWQRCAARHPLLVALAAGLLLAGLATMAMRAALQSSERKLISQDLQRAAGLQQEAAQSPDAVQGLILLAEAQAHLQAAQRLAPERTDIQQRLQASREEMQQQASTLKTPAPAAVPAR